MKKISFLICLIACGSLASLNASSGTIQKTDRGSFKYQALSLRRAAFDYSAAAFELTSIEVSDALQGNHGFEKTASLFSSNIKPSGFRFPDPAMSRQACFYKLKNYLHLIYPSHNFW